jgi:hypothetical protein
MSEFGFQYECAGTKVHRKDEYHFVASCAYL